VQHGHDEAALVQDDSDTHSARADEGLVRRGPTVKLGDGGNQPDQKQDEQPGQHGDAHLHRSQVELFTHQQRAEEQDQAEQQRTDE